MVMNFFLFIVLLVLLVLAAFFIGEKKGDVSGYGRGVNSMAHYKVKAEGALAQLAENKVTTDNYYNRLTKAEKASAANYANWQGEKSHRVALGEENGRLVAANTLLVGEKKTDQKRISDLTILSSFQQDTITRTREAFALLTTEHNLSVESGKALQATLTMTEGQLRKIKAVADRVVFADASLANAAKKERRTTLFLFAGIVIAVMNMLTIWAMARRKAGLPVLPDLHTAALELARQLPFL